MINLCDENFTLWAAKCYRNPQCFSTSEFESDLNRIKYIRKLFNKFNESGEMKTRLILNHIVILYNLFGLEATRLLWFKLKDYGSLLKPFLEFLGYLPEKITFGEPPETLNILDIISHEKIKDLLASI